MIQCNEINQSINYLLTKFQDCTKLKAEDMQLLVELIAAVNTCANGGLNYNTVISETHEASDSPLTIIYPVDTYHAISIVVLSGEIIYDGASIPVNASINIEVTTLNQTELEFVISPNGKVLVNYIIETV